MPADEERPAVERPPVKLEVPAPLTCKRLPTLNDVDEAIGRMDAPVTVRPPAKMVSPAETRRPFEDASPTAERPPAKVDVPVPDTVRRLVMVAEPSAA